MSDALVIPEHRSGELRDVSLELVTGARQYTDQSGGEVHVAVIGGDTDSFAQQLNKVGVDKIYTIADGKEFNHDVYTQAVNQIQQHVEAEVIFTPNTVNGLDYAPALAETRDIPIITDIIDFEVGDSVEVTREKYGSKVETTLDVGSDEAVITLRPSEWAPVEDYGGADIESFEVELNEAEIRSTVKGYEEVGGGDVDISEAEFVIAIGRGIDEEENLPLIEALADATDATLASSRPIVDNGWLPKNRQVGQSGKMISPDVYIAIGISGAVQHVAGIKGSDTIIAINSDPSAPIFDEADYGVVDDLFEVVPELIEIFGGEVPDV
jgi:electron transfer flavoprotein alpha subunit